MPMSEADVFPMFPASKAIEQYRGTPLQRMLGATFRKVTGQVDQSVRFSLGSLDRVLSFRPFAPGDAARRAGARGAAGPVDQDCAVALTGSPTGVSDELLRTA